jgi:hypothetical protein
MDPAFQPVPISPQKKILLGLGDVLMLDVQSQKKKSAVVLALRSTVVIWLVFRWAAAASIASTGTRTNAFSAANLARIELDGSRI